MRLEDMSANDKFSYHAAAGLKPAATENLETSEEVNSVALATSQLLNSLGVLNPRRIGIESQ